MLLKTGKSSLKQALSSYKYFGTTLINKLNTLS